MTTLLSQVVFDVAVLYFFSYMLHLDPKKLEPGMLFFNWQKQTPEGEFPVSLFDLVRVAFGVFDIRDKLYENENRSRLWRCPVCLGFWLSVPLVTIPAIGDNLIALLLSLAAVNGLHAFMWSLSS